MGKVDGVWCCYCDFCDESPCDGTGCSTVLFSNADFIGSCSVHNTNLDAFIAVYLAEHPSVTITEDSRTEDTADGTLPTTQSRSG